MSYRKILLSFMIITSVILSIMMTLSYRSNTKSLIAKEELPDAYMENVSAIIIDKNGNPSIKIETPRMLHYAKHDKSELIDPTLTIYRHSPLPWSVKAKYARALNGINHVVFWEDVVMHHDADSKNPTTTIKTPRLSLYPLEKKASTDEFITMIQPNLIIKATGMNADLNLGSVNLLREARGEYVPDA